MFRFGINLDTTYNLGKLDIECFHIIDIFIDDAWEIIAFSHVHKKARALFITYVKSFFCGKHPSYPSIYRYRIYQFWSKDK